MYGRNKKFSYAQKRSYYAGLRAGKRAAKSGYSKKRKYNKWR